MIVDWTVREKKRKKNPIVSFIPMFICQILLRFNCKVNFVFSYCSLIYNILFYTTYDT